jgi:hypothetical protein
LAIYAPIKGLSSHSSPFLKLSPKNCTVVEGKELMGGQKIEKTKKNQGIMNGEKLGKGNNGN